MLRLCKSSARQTISRRFQTSSLQTAISNGAPIDVHPEVQEALASKKPVVALETAIVTHGMPYPTNVNTARSMEAIARKHGAIPATIGLVQGRVKIGMTDPELDYLAESARSGGAVKVSRRDIAPLLSTKGDGGTTCSATLIFAALAGIKVFATGGLGGVHRGGEKSMDVSADLQELSRCPVGLVSAGAKSILDIGRTLEYLETLGVPVISYAETHDFPAFFVRQSGFKCPWKTTDPSVAAEMLARQEQLGFKNGVFYGVPIPEEFEEVGQEIQQFVEQAILESEENGVAKMGKEATPWLLKRVAELTAGKSIPSNIALVENTARVGAQIAVAYAGLGQEDGGSNTSRVHVTIPSPLTSKPIESTSSEPTGPCDLIVIGSAAVDITSCSSSTNSSLITHSTVPGEVSISLGGVGRNVAEAAHRSLVSASSDFAHRTMLLSPVGNDSFGRMLLDETTRIGMRSDGYFISDSQRTAVCNMFLDEKGALLGGVADMEITQAMDARPVIDALSKHKPSIVAVDGNLSESSLQSIVTFCRQNKIKVFFEPTSVAKSVRVLPAIASNLSETAPISFASPNILELTHMYQSCRTTAHELTSSPHWWACIDDMNLGSEFRLQLESLARRDISEGQSGTTLSFLIDQGVAQMAVNLLPFFDHLVIKCGASGIITVFNAPPDSLWTQEMTNMKARQVTAKGRRGTTLVLKHFPALQLAETEIVNVTGAGDSLVGSVLASLVQSPLAFQHPQQLERTILKAQKAAVMTLKSGLAVSPELSKSEHSEI